MSEKHLDILKPQAGCVSEEMLFRYAEGELSAEEARRVEEHIAGCEFCSDALEGIMGGDLQKFQVMIDSINRDIERKTSLPKIFQINRFLQIAAAVVVIAVSVWFVNVVTEKPADKIFSDQFKPYPAPQTDNSTLSPPPAVSEDKTQPAAPVKKENKSETESQEKYSPKESLHTQETSSQNSVSAHDEKNESTKIPEEPAPTQAETFDREATITMDDKKTDATQEDLSSAKVNVDSSVVISGSASYSAAPPQVVTIKQTPISLSQYEVETNATKDSYRIDITDDFNKAMALYQSNHYAEAIAGFQFVLKQEPNNPAANFYSGVSSLALKNPDEALKYFKKTDYKSCQYYEATLWYEALSYLSKNDKKQAKKLLDKVVELHGEYKVKAEETLKEL